MEVECRMEQGEEQDDGGEETGEVAEIREEKERNSLSCVWAW